MEKPPIDSELAFTQVSRISDTLVALGMKHSVVCNPYREPLAIHIPQVMTEAEAAHHAELFDAVSAERVKIYNSPYLTPATYNAALRWARRTQAVSPKTLEPYPSKVTKLIKHVGQTILPDLKPIDYLPAEISSGDSIPHYDYMAQGDMTNYVEEAQGPNIHITLRGEGVVRVGQVRQASQLILMKDAIAEAMRNKMTDFEVFSNLTTDFIKQNEDPRVPESLKRSVHNIDEVMGQATPYVSLKPGDAFIFHGHARKLNIGGRREILLPVVHHFQTTSATPRVSAVFRSKFEHPGVTIIDWFSPYNTTPSVYRHFRVGYGDRAMEGNAR